MRAAFALGGSSLFRTRRVAAKSPRLPRRRSPPLRRARVAVAVANAPLGKRAEPPALRFARLAACQWRALVLAAAAAAVGVVCGVSQPLLVGRILGALNNTKGLAAPAVRGLLCARLAATAAVYLVEAAATFAFVAVMTRFAETLVRRLRATVFEEVLRNDIGFFDIVGRSYIARVLSSDFRTVKDGIWDNLTRDRGIRCLLEAMLGVIITIRLCAGVGIPVFGVIAPIAAFVAAKASVNTGQLAGKLASREEEVQFLARQTLEKIRTVKAFGAESREVNALGDALDSAQKGAWKLGFAKARTDSINRVALYIIILSMFSVGGWLVYSGRLAFDMFISLTGYIWILTFAYQGLTFTLTDLAKVGFSLKEIYGLLDRAADYRASGSVVSTNGKLSSASQSTVRGEIVFSNVRFRYPTRPEAEVLRGINFTLTPGSVVALCGDSGGGKSTIAALISRFYAPTSGTITLGGVDIQTIPRDVYTKQISVVNQEPVLFRGSLRENIAYGASGDAEISDEDIFRAATEANAHTFISQLPDGYDTIFDAGSALSGGQKQRVAIARAIIRDSPLMVLDEATSALDVESEKTVQLALDRLMKNRTVLVIAHRLSTIQNADTILFVKDGRILEGGSYDELMDMDGAFRRLVGTSSVIASD